MPAKKHQEKLAELGKELSDLPVLGRDLHSEGADQYTRREKPDYRR